jgi:hypothetical protein
MAEQIFVELSQRDGTTYGPGDYTVTIPPGISIDEGDQVMLNKVFIDNAAASSQKIVINEPLTLDIGVGYYQQLVRKDNQDNGINGNTGYGSDPFVDCKTYVLCEKTAGGAGFVLPGISVISDQDQTWLTPLPSGSNPKHNVEYIQVFVTIEYTAPSGAVKQQTVDLSLYGWTSSQNGRSWQSGEIDAIVFDKTKPVKFKNFVIGKTPSGTRPVMNPTQYYNNNTTAIVQFEILPEGGGEYFYKCDWAFNPAPSGASTPSAQKTQPLIRTASRVGTDIVVPKGTFTPADLAALINDQIQKNYASGGSLLDSLFLLQYTPTAYPNTVWVAAREPNGTVVAAFETTPALAAANALLIGATQMELSWDEDRQTFFWAYAHSPYKFGVPAAESVGYLPTTGITAGNTTQVVTRNSGVFFTELSATNAAGLTVPFWDQYLGFDLGSITVANGTKSTGNINGWAAGDLYLPSSLETGVKTTTGYLGLSSLSDARTNDVWWLMPVIDPADGFFDTSSGESVPIFASREDIAANTDTTGYYLISVDGKTGSDYRGSNGYRSNSINAVVSKYYNSGSYTTGTDADAIPYVHHGPSINLSSWRVRILAPNKSVATDLGLKSAVILQITKAMAVQKSTG